MNIMKRNLLYLAGFLQPLLFSPAVMTMIHPITT